MRPSRSLQSSCWAAAYSSVAIISYLNQILGVPDQSAQMGWYGALRRACNRYKTTSTRSTNTYISQDCGLCCQVQPAGDVPNGVPISHS